ncbi:MAG: DinB family protein [Flavicella sp.]
MLQPIVDNLQKSLVLLSSISNTTYTDSSVAPYHVSIGGHLRHLLDFYACFFSGYSKGEVDLTTRNRALLIETDQEAAKAYAMRIIAQLKSIENDDFKRILHVTDDLGRGKQTVTYSVAALLFQIHSHTLHHYASIGYIVYQLGISIEDSTFGVNPTSPKYKVVGGDR